MDSRLQIVQPIRLDDATLQQQPKRKVNNSIALQTPTLHIKEGEWRMIPTYVLQMQLVYIWRQDHWPFLVDHLLDECRVDFVVKLESLFFVFCPVVFFFLLFNVRLLLWRVMVVVAVDGRSYASAATLTVGGREAATKNNECKHVCNLPLWRRSICTIIVV